MTLKRLLIIAYYFPPDGGGGVQRPAKFCRYLPAFGWEPVVLTRGANDASGWDVCADTGLAEQVGATTQINRVPTEPARDWARKLPTIDIAGPWLEPALREATRLIKTRSIDAVLITMSPFDLCHVGQRLQQVCDVPIIYDLRDPWALDGWRLHGTKQRWRHDTQAMRETLTQACGVIANTSESARALQAAVPSLDSARMRTIPNGYDAADFETPLPPTPPRETGYFHLVHTGTFVTRELYRYEGWLGRFKRWRHYRPRNIVPSGRTPYHLFRAVQRLREEQHPLAQRLRLVFVGQLDPWTQRCIQESGLSDIVHSTGYQPHDVSVAWVRHADGLFLPLGGLPEGARSLIVPGKTYEYLAARRPILGALPPGDARDMVERSGMGFCAAPCNEAELAAALIAMDTAVQSGTMNDRPTPAWLPKYERKALTGELARFLDQLIQRPHATSPAGETATAEAEP